MVLENTGHSLALLSINNIPSHSVKIVITVMRKPQALLHTAFPKLWKAVYPFM